LKQTNNLNGVSRAKPEGRKLRRLEDFTEADFERLRRYFQRAEARGEIVDTFTYKECTYREEELV